MYPFRLKLRNNFFILRGGREQERDGERGAKEREVVRGKEGEREE